MTKECYAPVFDGIRNIFHSFLLIITYAAAIFILFFFIWISSVRCLIPQYGFRISHMRDGNSDPNILI